MRENVRELQFFIIIFPQNINSLGLKHCLLRTLDTEDMRPAHGLHIQAFRVGEGERLGHSDSRLLLVVTLVGAPSDCSVTTPRNYREYWVPDAISSIAYVSFMSELSLWPVHLNFFSSWNALRGSTDWSDGHKHGCPQAPAPLLQPGVCSVEQETLTCQRPV